MFNPDWFLTDEQKALREQLIEICEKEIRPRARDNDTNLTFPRESLEALGPFLGVTLPKAWGGLEQNHVMLAVTTETIARYGDASAAMCYTMHIGAVEALRLTRERAPDRDLAQAGRAGSPDRHPVLLRPRDRLALLVPDLLGRPRASRAATRC